jgi:hypothetical protein
MVRAIDYIIATFRLAYKFISLILGLANLLAIQQASQLTPIYNSLSIPLYLTIMFIFEP